MTRDQFEQKKSALISLRRLGFTYLEQRALEVHFPKRFQWDIEALTRVEKKLGSPMTYYEEPDES